MIQLNQLQDIGPGTPARLAPVYDRRADGHVRAVSLTRDMVRIDRRLDGIAMRLAVPVQAYRGVALSLEPADDGQLCYRLHLLHADRDLSVTLEAAPDDSDILADWRLWSRFFRLPALVERRPGEMVPAEPSLASLPEGTGAVTRRALRNPRRPRFLRRRKLGVWSKDAAIHGDEREIIAPE